MITLTYLHEQTISGLAVPNGSMILQLNTDASVLAAPYGLVMSNIAVSFSFDKNGDLEPGAQIWSNAELLPQNAQGFGTYYLVTFYDQNGSRTNLAPMWWQFQNPAGATVDISTMTAYAIVGGNVIFYPRIPSNISIVSAIQFVIDGGGGVPATGKWGQISIPYDCTITGWTITGDVSGDAIIDVLKTSYSGFPSTVSLAGTDKPNLTAAQKNNDSTLLDWGNTALLAGDELQINLENVATVTRINLTLEILVPFSVTA